MAVPRRSRSTATRKREQRLVNTKRICAATIQTGGAICLIRSATEPWAVVVTVIVTDVLVCVALNMTVPGLKLHALAGGKLEQIDGDSMAEPTKPPCSVNMRVVEPDWPGLGMTIVPGFAVIANVATVTVIVPEEPE